MLSRVAIFTFHYASTLSAHLLRMRQPVQNLHSTMLLLYQGLSLTQTRCIQYLHSTMLLLYLRPAIIWRHLFSNLHSTMLLLYRTCILQECLTRLIYIPLCFYFIPIADNTFTAAFPIYIPLCFYFIVNTAIAISCPFPNLHSTMLLLYPIASHNFNSRSILFTFHYASTLSSTYPLDTLSANAIYIPLCFYFIKVFCVVALHAF